MWDRSWYNEAMALRRRDIKGLEYWKLDFPTGSAFARSGLSSYEKTLSFFGYRYYEGLKGIGIYTVQPDEGWYYVFHCRKSGPGQLNGTWDGTYAFVPRLTTKRKSKKSAIDRAYALAHGRSRQALTESKPKQDHHPMTGYCLACKLHVTVGSWEERTTKNGRTMLESWCPLCDDKSALPDQDSGHHKATRITKYGKLMNCPGCDQRNPEEKGDYLCKVCRWDESQTESQSSETNTMTKS